MLTLSAHRCDLNTTLKTLSVSGYPADEDGEPVDLCYLDSEKQPQGYFKSQNDAFLQVKFFSFLL